MSGRSSGSKPYSVTESNAVDSRVAGSPDGEEMEPTVGPEGDRPRRRTCGPGPRRPLEGEHTGGEGEVAGQVLRPEPPHQLSVLGDPGQGHLGDAVPRQRRAATGPGVGVVPSKRHPRVRPLSTTVPAAASHSSRSRRPSGSRADSDRRPVVPGRRRRSLGARPRAQHRGRTAGPAGFGRQLGGGGVIAVHGLGDLGQVAAASARDDRRRLGRGSRRRSAGSTPGPVTRPLPDSRSRRCWYRAVTRRR